MTTFYTQSESIAGYYFVLPRALEAEITRYAQNTSVLCCHFYWDDPETVTVVFWEPEDAAGFIRLFKQAILHTYSVGVPAELPATV
jgi:hypothetical protein